MSPRVSPRLVAAACVLAIAAFVLLGEISRRFPLRLDATTARGHSLSARTLAVLDSLGEPVTLTSIVAHSAAPENEEEAIALEVAPALRDLLDAFSAAAPQRIQTITIDALREPSRAQRALERARARLPNVVVVERGSKRRVVGLARMVELVQGVRASDSPRIGRFRGEEALLDALLSLEPSIHPVVRFGKTMGERDVADTSPEGISDLDRRLRAEGFDTHTIDLEATRVVPPDTRVLVIAGPRAMFGESHAAAIDSFLAGGGALFAMLDPRYLEGADGSATPAPTGLEGLLKRRGIRVHPGLLIDTKNAIPGAQADTFLVRDFARREPVQSLGGLSVLVSNARAVDGPIVLARSSPAARRAPSPDSLAEGAPSSVPIAVLSEREGRVVVVGDSDLASNAHFSRTGNRELVLRIIEHLALARARVSLPARAAATLRVTLGDSDVRLALWLFVLVLPGVAATIALILAFTRRRQG